MAKKQSVIESSGGSVKSKDMYIVWRSMPVALRVMSPEKLDELGYNTDDPIFQKLLTIKSDNQFTIEFHLSNNQIARWREDEDFTKAVEDIARNDHILRFEKDVDFAFTQRTIKEADAPRVKLWKQLYRGWAETSKSVNTNVDIDAVKFVKEIEERNAKYRTV